MTMLDIMKGRLPEEATILKATEKPNRFELIVEVDGKPTKGTLPKTCAPDMAENVVDFSICVFMIGAYLETGNFEKAKVWKEKQEKLVRLI